MCARYGVWYDRASSPHPLAWDETTSLRRLPGARYALRMMQELERELVAHDRALEAPLARLRVLLTPNPGEIPWHGPDVLVLLANDEWDRVPPYAGEVGLVLAPMRGRPVADAFRAGFTVLGAVDVLDEVRVRVERAAWQRARPPGDAASVAGVPLGYAHQVEVPFVPWEDREIDVFFAGSLVHGSHRGGSVRKALRARVGNAKTVHRRQMLAAVERLRAEAPGLRVEVQLVAGDDPGASAESYSRTLATSRFALDPRGTHRETFRFSEASRVGAVPVVTSLPSVPLYAGAGAVRLRRWSELVPAMRVMQSDPARARALHEQALAWWRRSGSEQAAARRLVGPVAELLRALPDE